MNLLRDRLQRLTEQLPGLIEQLSDESLEDAWKILQPLYYDLYMLTAMQESMRTVRPGDNLTREEALLWLLFPWVLQRKIFRKGVRIRPVSIEVRYARSFLRDLKNLESAAYQQVFAVVFNEFMGLKQIQDLPELHQIGSDAMFYRFTIDNYIVGIEVTGHIVKFLRVLPKPYIWTTELDYGKT